MHYGFERANASLALAQRIATVGVSFSMTLAIVALTGCMPIAESQVELEVIDYGVLEGGQVTMRPDETSSVGAMRANSMSMRISARTARVPLRAGLSYGLAFRVTKAPSEEVSIKGILRTSAPCVLKATGNVVYHNDTVLKVKVGEVRHLGARIPASDTENHCRGEPKPGTDTFQLYFGDQKLAEKTFEVYRE